MRHRKLLAVAATGELALGAAACGSSDDSSTTSASTARAAGTAASTELGGTINGAGATFPQPVYSEWANRFKEAAGTTVNYQGDRLGRRHRPVHRRHRRLRRHRRGDEADEEVTAAKKKGDPVHIPTVLGAVTVSYNVAGRREGPQARRRDDRRHLPRQDQEVERPGDRRPQRRRRPAGHRHHRLPPLRRVRHDEELHRSSSPTTRPSGRAAPASTRRSSGRPAPARRATTASPAASSRPTGAVGYVEQAYALQNDFTTAAVKNKDGAVRRADAGRHLGRRRGRDAAGGPALLDDQRRRARRPTRSPRSRSCSSGRTRARRACSTDSRGRSRPGSTTSSATARRSRRSCEYAPLPDPHQEQAQAKVDAPAVQRKRRSRRQLMARPGRSHPPASAACAAALAGGPAPRSAPEVGPDGAVGRRHRPASRSSSSGSSIESRAGLRRGRRRRLPLRQRLGRRRRTSTARCRCSSARSSRRPSPCCIGVPVAVATALLHHRAVPAPHRAAR